MTNLWQGVNGINNPCPSGYRIPTEAELDAEHLSWSSDNSAGAIASALKLPMAGYRSSAMVRSTMSVPTATIGAVRLVALARATSPSAAALPTWTTTPSVRILCALPQGLTLNAALA